MTISLLARRTAAETGTTVCWVFSCPFFDKFESPRALRRICRRDSAETPAFARFASHGVAGRGGAVSTGFPVVIGEGPHPFPFRTRKLSPLPPMVLQGRLCGRVGHCREYPRKGPTPSGIGPRNTPGSDLLSHRVTPEVPSAVEGLTTVFGMGTGVAPLL